MLEKPSEIIYFYLSKIGIPIFPCLSVLCLLLLVLLKEDIKRWTEIPFVDKANVVIIASLFACFTYISVLYHF
jgi:Mn2+/Fe2+ NRAMP family transporter